MKSASKIEVGRESIDSTAFSTAPRSPLFLILKHTFEASWSKAMLMGSNGRKKLLKVLRNNTE